MLKKKGSAVYILSERSKRIVASPILGLNAKVQALKAHGKDVINLTVGEPDFDTPDWIQEAAIRALREGQTRYTAVEGTFALRDTLQKSIQERYGLDYERDQIIVSTGGKQVLFNSLMATLNAKDEVILPAPYWSSYIEMIQLFGGTPVIVPCTEETGFKITPQLLEAAITEKTKWFILNSPTNPTGAVYTRDELKALAAVLYQNPQLWILCDDIYEKLIYDDLEFHSIVKVEPRLKLRTLIVNGFSKTYAMTGWRLGYGVGPRELIQSMTSIQSQSTSSACSMVQCAAIAALNGPHHFLLNWTAAYARRRDFVMNCLNNIPGLKCLKPHGAFYLYVNCQDLIGLKTPAGRVLHTDEDVCFYLLETAQVAVVHGAVFGLSPYFRLSYAVDDALLEEACVRIANAIALLKPESKLYD